MDTTERNALRATILDMVSPGIKGVELACEVALRHREVGDTLFQTLADMVAMGEIVEVEYVTPDNRHGDEARVKSFYLPAGTEVRLGEARAIAA